MPTPSGGGSGPGGSTESPRERIERLVRAGELTADEVLRAERMWEERLRVGVRMPNGEVARFTKDDLYHAMIDRRVRRSLPRIEPLLQGIFEIRSSERDRRVGLSRWEEAGRLLVGYVVLQPDSRVWTVHFIDERRLRRLMRRGDLLWRP
jgi:hypothetical protein